MAVACPMMLNEAFCRGFGGAYLRQIRHEEPLPVFHQFLNLQDQSVQWLFVKSEKLRHKCAATNTRVTAVNCAGVGGGVNHVQFVSEGLFLFFIILGVSF